MLCYHACCTLRAHLTVCIIIITPGAIIYGKWEFIYFPFGPVKYSMLGKLHVLVTRSRIKNHGQVSYMR